MKRLFFLLLVLLNNVALSQDLTIKDLEGVWRNMTKFDYNHRSYLIIRYSKYFNVVDIEEEGLLFDIDTIGFVSYEDGYAYDDNGDGRKKGFPKKKINVLMNMMSRKETLLRLEGYALLICDEIDKGYMGLYYLRFKRIIFLNTPKLKNSQKT